VATVEWTFPLEMVAIMSGDGEHTGRQVIPVMELPPFCQQRFRISFDESDTTRIRVAVSDLAGNRALVHPVRLWHATQPARDQSLADQSERRRQR
jgi:hypothetical protein